MAQNQKGKQSLKTQRRHHAHIDRGNRVSVIAKKRLPALRRRPAACLIENTANGPALIEEATRKKWLKVIPIIPDGRSKTARLVAHIGTLQKGHIQLPVLAIWLEAYITEFLEFPHGCNDDQIDATTQYLDYMDTKPNLVLPPPRGLVAFGINRGQSIGQFPSRLDIQKIGPVMRHYR